MSASVSKVRRSGLVMPVVTPRFVENAWRRESDYIILDLEDSVPSHLKGAARSLVKAAVTKVARGGAEVFVRINNDQLIEDLEACVWPGVAGIRHPKTESADEVRLIDEIITRLEQERGIPPGTVTIDPCTESAAGIARIHEIVGASPRVREVSAPSNGHDLSRDLGMEMFQDFDQLSYARGECELAGRALGLPVRTAPFIENTSGSYSNIERALQQAEAARRCGLRRGLGSVNPALISTYNAGYTPTSEEVDDALWVLDQYLLVDAAGQAWAQVGDRILDRYEARRARETLEYAAACAERDLEKKLAVEHTAARIEDDQ